MVVTANDSYLADAGFADDAPDAMPDFGDGAMPMDGDIAALPDGVFEDGAATPEPEPFSVESLPLTPEQLDAFRAHIESELTPALQAQIAEREALWEQQRTSLEAKVNAFDQQRRQAANVLAARQKVYAKYFQDMGVEERDFKALEYEVGQEARRLGQFQAQQQAQSQQVQQSQAGEAAEYQAAMTQAEGLMFDYARSVGLDPNNAKVKTMLMDAYAPVIAASEVFRQFPTEAAFNAVTAAKKTHKAWVESLGKQASRARAAKPSSDAVARQRERGVQNLGRGSGGGNAPLSIIDHLDAVTKESPNLSYKERHTIAANRYYAQQQSR